MSKVLLKPGFLIGIGIGLLISLFSLTDFSDKLENHAFDFFMRKTADPKKWPSKIVIVTIDYDWVNRQYLLENPDPQSSIRSFVESVAKKLNLNIPQQKSFLIRWYGTEHDLHVSAIKAATTGLEIVEKISKEAPPGTEN